MTSTTTTTPATARQDPGMPETPLDWIAGTGAFAVEVALGITWGVVGHRLGSRIAGPAGGWIGALIAVLALVAVWSTWMSPNADHRLGLTGRLVLGCGLILLAAAAAWLTGSTTWALILAIGGIAVTVAAQALLD